MACPLFRHGSAGCLPPPPPTIGRGGMVEQAPAPFLLWSSQLQSHPPILGSRDSKSPLGVCSVSSWSMTCRTLSDFDLSSSVMATLYPVASLNGQLYLPEPFIGFPSGLSLILAPRALPQSSAVLPISCAYDIKSLVYSITA